MEEDMNQNKTFSLSQDCYMVKLDNEVLSNCNPFSCGDADLDDFFANDAIAYENDKMGKTYCWLLKCDITKIVGMITLANAGIQTTHLKNHPKRKLNDHIAYNKRGRTYPAVLIGRLGVDTQFQGKDFRIGAQIMDFIKAWFDGSENKTGCRFVIVDAINNEHTVRYYERNGFRPLFPREQDEKDFYDIADDESLRTRMYYFDLL
jgi:GNAT superfamily N-acetyltransferase